MTGWIPEPNPGRVGACGECGAWRTDGRPPYLHRPGCTREDDLQIDRFLAEHAAGDLGGPVLYGTAVDAARARQLGVRETAVDGGQ
jgi:hypothetical protein